MLGKNTSNYISMNDSQKNLLFTAHAMLTLNSFYTLVYYSLLLPLCVSMAWGLYIKLSNWLEVYVVSSFFLLFFIQLFLCFVRSCFHLILPFYLFRSSILVSPRLRHPQEACSPRPTSWHKLVRSRPLL